MLAVDELFDVSGSGIGELTEAVLLMTVPSVADALTATVKRTVSEAPPASCEKVTLPPTPHTPFPVAAHFVNVRPAGRLSVTIASAGIPPLFFTSSENVKVLPGATRF